MPLKSERPVIEPLQPRLLLAGSTLVPGKPVLPFNPQGNFITNPDDPFPRPRAVLGKRGTLEVFGSFENDRIEVNVGWVNGANRITVSVNGRERRVRLVDVKRLTISGDFGDDNISVNDPRGLLGPNRRVSIFGDGGDAGDNNFNTGADTIAGTAFRDNIDAGRGDDKIESYGGSDSIDAGAGNDTVTAGAGNDTIKGGDTDSPVDINEMIGGDGDDSITGGFFKDYIYGGDGNDSLSGFFGDDYISAGAGNDFVTGHSGFDTIFGSEGDDTIRGDLGDVPSRQFAPPVPDNADDRIYGGPGNDSLLGEGGDDLIYGEAGSDTLLGHFGRDHLDGGTGNDYLNGHEDADRISGRGGRDLFNLIDLNTPAGQTDFNPASDNPNTRPRQATFRSEELPIDVLS
jgi:Ca2+-binding RTX toxin-like protein